MLQVEPALENERGGLLIDHLLALARDRSASSRTRCGLGGRETLVLLVKFQRRGARARERTDELLHAPGAMPDLAGQLEWHSDHEIGDAVLDNECLDRRHVGVVPARVDDLERVRSDTRLVGDGDTDGLLPTSSPSARIAAVSGKKKGPARGIAGPGRRSK